MDFFACCDFKLKLMSPINSFTSIHFFVSYKENDSTQETDSDEVVEVAVGEEVEEDECTESLEKIMDHRVRIV